MTSSKWTSVPSESSRFSTKEFRRITSKATSHYPHPLLTAQSEILLILRRRIPRNPRPLGRSLCPQPCQSLVLRPGLPQHNNRAKRLAVHARHQINISGVILPPKLPDLNLFYAHFLRP